MIQYIMNFVVGFSLILWSIIYSIISPWFPKKFVHKNVSKQIVLITGGGSGFGRLMAQKFANDEGAIVVIWDINKPGLDETMKLVKDGGAGKCHSYVVDVSSRQEIYAAAKIVQAEVGKVDILINNAGIGGGTYLIDQSDEEIEKSFQVNTLSNFWTTKAFLPAMGSSKSGHVVTIASAAGLFGVAGLATYCASKHAVVGFHESLTNEVKICYPEAQIQTTVICPYFVLTPMLSGKEDRLPPSTLFLPIREPEPVVDEIMDAILSNTNFFIPSWGVRVVLFLKSNTPTLVMQKIREVILPVGYKRKTK